MHNTANIIDVTEATFQTEVIERSHEIPVVVDFWAAWCGPCRMLGPILERLAAEPGSSFVLAKVDVDANPGLSMRYQVQGIPAVKAFRDGVVADEFVGAQPEPRVRQFLQRLAPNKADQKLDQAVEMLAARRWSEAAALFQALLAEDPTHGEAQLGLIRTMIVQDQSCLAKEQLEQLIHVPAFMSRAETLLPLADYVCQYGRFEDDAAELTVVEALYRRAAGLLAAGKPAAALDGLLDVLRHNKNYRDGKVKAVLLGIFALLGDQDPLTNQYRREMASVLF